MVRNLFRNELGTSMKLYVPVFVLIAVCTIVGTIAGVQFGFMLREGTRDSSYIIFGLATLVIGIGITAIVVLNLMATIKILYTNMYKYNAYRLFTYPVKSWEIFVAKILIVCFWSLLISIATILALFVVFAAAGIASRISWNEISYMIQTLINEFQSLIYYDGFIGYLLGITQSIVRMTSFAILLMLAGAIAHSSSVSRHRAWFTFLFYVGLYILMNIIGHILRLDQAGQAIEISDWFWGGNIYVNKLSHLYQLYTLFMNSALLLAASFGCIWFWDHKLEITN